MTVDDQPIARLPASLRHRVARGLIRLGRDHDGGYILSAEDVTRSDILISLGINEDWSFEEAFVALNDVPIAAYDGSVSEEVFSRQFRYSLLPIPIPWKALDRWHLRRRFRGFFQGRRRHHPLFVGSVTHANFISMADVFAATPSQRIFLKIDVEGEEYRLLDTILENQHRLTGLVIEFHTCDLHIDRIERFATRLSMPLVHLHANNYAPCDRRSGVPILIEATFSAHAALTAEQRAYPMPLDQPCNRDLPDYRIVFDDVV